ncbi:uncharacterized protein LOC129057685 [Pongo abelii]|uniref:uncharacterized protein LOC129057685 n=1 Tax=Pongo abelii TaxID=9601 RepID=UPI0023E8B6D1|nr:uncharacterized protein LOC129057685 [Pongo abelii]
MWIYLPKDFSSSILAPGPLDPSSVRAGAQRTAPPWGISPRSCHYISNGRNYFPGTPGERANNSTVAPDRDPWTEGTYRCGFFGDILHATPDFELFLEKQAIWQQSFWILRRQ